MVAEAAALAAIFDAFFLAALLLASIFFAVFPFSSSAMSSLASLSALPLCKLRTTTGVLFKICRALFAACLTAAVADDPSSLAKAERARGSDLIAAWLAAFKASLASAIAAPAAMLSSPKSSVARGGMAPALAILTRLSALLARFARAIAACSCTAML